MPFTVDDQPFGSLSVTLADNDATLAASIMATAPATLSLSVYGAAPGVPLGGTTGSVLKKNSNADWDTVWGTDLASAAWGTITGTLSSQTDLQTALDLKAPLASPALTGVPTAPTAATLTSTTQLATTAFVQQELAAGTAVAKNLEVYVRNQTGATLAAGTIVYINGATGNRPTVTKAQANNDANSAQTFGFIKTSIANNSFGYVIVRGEVENLDTSALTEGQQLYLSPTTAGTWTTTKPYAPNHLVYVGIVVRAHPTQGVILVAIQNGYELDEIHDVKITTPSNGQVLKYDSAQGLWVNGTDSSGVAWGGITGTLSAQTDLQSALDSKASATNAFLSGTTEFGGAVNFTTGSNTHQAFFPSITGAPAILSNGYLWYNTSGFNYYDGTNSQLIATQSWVTSQGYLTSAPVTSVAGKTGAVTLSNTDISGLGTMATATASDYLSKAGNLSGLANTATARTNLGLGTMAVETASNYLTTATASSTYAPLASPALTGTPTAPTAAQNTNTTQVATTAYVIGQGNSTAATIAMDGTQAAGTSNLYARADHVHPTDTSRAPLASPALTGTPTAPTAAAATNTTQIATTAFVQQEVPAASTTASGKVELATNAEAIAGTSTTLVPSISNIPAIISHPELRSLAHITSTSVSGSGAVTSAATAYGLREFYLSSLATGRARFMYYLVGNVGPSMSRADRSKLDFSKKIWMGGKCCLGIGGATSYLGDSNTMTRITLGGYTTDTTGDMTVRGIGFKKVGGTASAISLTVHNGTTLTDVATTKTCADGESIDWMIYSDGAGNVTLYINGTQEATTTAGPTSATAAHQCAYREQVEATSTPGVRGLIHASGGWLYIEA